MITDANCSWQYGNPYNISEAGRPVVGRDSGGFVFIRGKVLYSVEGRDMGWQDCRYYLVQPTKRFNPDRTPHWVREDEI